MFLLSAFDGVVSPNVSVSLCDPEIMSICSIEIEMAYFYFSGVGQQYI